MTGWLGRLLCRVGLHRWEQLEATDRLDDDSDPNYRRYEVTTYCWCRRPSCPRSNGVSGVEEREFRFS